MSPEVVSREDARRRVLEVDGVRNRRMGAGLVDDPYPRYDELRVTGPVHEGTIAEHFGVPEFHRVHWDLNFAAYDWATVDRILRDDETFSNSSYVPTIEPFLGRTILQMDAPEHRRYRVLALPGLARPDMARWERTWVQPFLTRLVDEIAARPDRRAELFEDLCARLPVHTIAKSWGLDDDDVYQVHELAISQLSPGGGGSDDAARAGAALADLVREQVARRRVEPADDLISLMCQAELVDDAGDRHRLTDEEVLSFARLLLTAGAGTTHRGLGSLLLALLQDREQLALVRDEGLAAAAVEEGLRFEQPLTSVVRVATRDCELAGVTIPAGGSVHASLAAANHDPARWEDPHRFDLTRRPVPHLSFGFGAHLCIGLHLARMEMRAALDALFARFPDLRLDPDVPEPHMTGLGFRVPTGLPVVWG